MSRKVHAADPRFIYTIALPGGEKYTFRDLAEPYVPPVVGQKYRLVYSTMAVTTRVVDVLEDLHGGPVWVELESVSDNEEKLLSILQNRGWQFSDQDLSE